MKPQNVFSYYRDCYKADSTDLNLWNLNKLKSADKLTLTGQDELRTGFLTHLPIPADFAEPLSKRVEMYQRERVLLYVSFLVVGKIEIKGEIKQVVSPLIFNEAHLTANNSPTGQTTNDNQYYALSTEQSMPEVNQALVDLLLAEQADDPTVLTMLNNADVREPSFWTALLKNSPLNIDYLSLLNFPTLANNDDIKTALRKKSPSILPVSMLVFIERSTSSRGVLHELDSISTHDEISAPLAQLIKPHTVKYKNNKNLKYDYLPGLLSKPQQALISIAAHQAIGCASGPPGTGKSYTIAAIAAEHMARGESVLIVANNDAALDVIGSKLETNFNLNDVSIRAGQKIFLKQFKNYIADLLAGYFSDALNQQPDACEKQLKNTNKLLQKIEKRFIHFCKKAITRGQRLKNLQQKDNSWLYRLYLKWAQRQIKQLVDQWAALDSINEQHLNREALASQYLSALKNKNLKKLVDKHRTSLQAFNKAIRSRSSKRQFELFDTIEYPALLSAFPIWLVSLNSLYRVLPLKTEMFDLVIIDEATQCNIASCLPALYRAKRAMIVGDTKQLRHYSFLAKHKEAQLMVKNKVSTEHHAVVSYRDNSILDLTLSVLTNTNQLAFLDEHFRSKPELIHFSNVHFYQNKLKIMQHRPCTRSGFLEIEQVKGERDKAGINLIEAQCVIAAIKQQITDDEQTGYVHSIGVISPFRHQAEFIAQLIESEFTQQDITQHQLRSASPFGFQGEERDIMLISFAVDNQAKRASAYLNKPDVFNVTITRARQKQILFLSIDEQNLNEKSLLKKYINSATEFSANHQTALKLDTFQSEIISELNKKNIETWPGYTLANNDIDVLCRYKNRYLALDLIGYPGSWGNYFELNTYKLLKRANIDILPISYGLWVVEPNTCLTKIIEQLTKD
ncbi:DEAD/DEAH box helicase [Algibacillus agarilyticus]|uniref:DEAD/DEAH box helicase n=1 Tax=Algibacillus agarilyticus TaxID=2234133 RepID=UPI000DD02026|nr:DEAD/DEAH box helicase [Algibacillus agarilyticus]